MNLSNTSVSELFTIPNSDWTAVNKRVGVVLVAKKIASEISTMFIDYPALLTQCETWQLTTFNGLIAESQALAKYANTAITTFSALNSKIKPLIKNGAPVTEVIQVEIKTALQQLNASTKIIVTQFTTLNKTLSAFLTANEVVDKEWETIKNNYGNFWTSIETEILSFENSTQHLLSVWSAIKDDLNSATNPDIIVDIPFIESLNIDAAIVKWQTIYNEANAFPTAVSNQKQYWTNPF